MKKIFLKNNKGISLIPVIIIVIIFVVLSAILISIIQGKSENITENTNNQLSGENNLEENEDVLQGQEHKHNYSLFISTQSKATCQTKARNKYSCECGATIVKEEGETAEHSWNNGVVKKEPTKTEEGLKEYKCLVCGEIKEETIQRTESTYLVDVVEIGDYVDLGIEYTNQLTSNTIQDSSNLTGWRVLSKTGSGSTGTVKLVSAGIPLVFNHVSTQDAESTIKYLNDLNKEIYIMANISDQGFVKNGFNDNDLASIWEEGKQINLAQGIHTITTEEIAYAYSVLTEKTTTIENLAKMDVPFSTSNMKTVNSKMNERANDLLGNGIYYWLGGTVSANYSNVYCVTNENGVNDTFTDDFGVRPVVTLNRGAEISIENTGDGTSNERAYILK